MVDQVSVPSTEELPILDDEADTLEELPILDDEADTLEELPILDDEADTLTAKKADTLIAKADYNTVQSALDEGQHVSTVEDMLVSEYGMEQQDARNLVVNTIQPQIDSAVEEYGEDLIRQTLATDYEYSEDLINDLFGGREPKILPQLVPVTEEASVTGDDLSYLTTLAKNVHELQMPMLQGLYANIFEDHRSMTEYRQITTETNYAIANTLRKLGKNIEVDDDGRLIDAETGLEVDTGFIDSMVAAREELVGAVGGGVLGGATVAKVASSVFGMTPWGRTAKLAAIIGGGFAGSGIGASLGRAHDVLRNAVLVKQEVDANFVVERMKDAGVFDVTASIIGTPLLAASSAAIMKIVGFSYDKFFKGNERGAYRGLKDLMHINDKQVDELMEAWEKVADKKIKGSRIKRALTIIPQTKSGGEDIVRAAAGISPTAGAELARRIDFRAKDLLKAASELTNDTVGTRLQDGLSDYENSVKNFYAGVEDFAADSMKDVPYEFDYSSLVLDPIMSRIHTDLINPKFKEQFGNFIIKIQNMGRPGEKMRSFDDLLELRKTINEFKYQTPIKNKKDFDAVNSVISKIDKEVAKVAKEHMPNGKLWLSDWKRARTEYSNMIQLRENVLYQSLTQAGVNPKQVVAALSNRITSLDGTLVKVIAKLPQKERSLAEGAVLDELAKKHTISSESGSQAVNFIHLAEELNNIGFKTPKVRELKRAVNQMAEVIENDTALSRAKGKVTGTANSSYLTDEIDSRIRYEFLTTVFNYVKRLLPTEKGRITALTMKVSKFIENPANTKSIKDLIKELPDDPELKSTLHRIATEHAKLGTRDISPKVRVYRTGTPGTAPKAKEGSLGKGIYWSTDKAAMRRRSRITGGKVIKEEILPKRIATEQNVKDILDVEYFDPTPLDTKLVKLLKRGGYDGVSIGDSVMMFK